MDNARSAFGVIQSFLTIKVVSYQLVQFFKLCFPDITAHTGVKKKSKKAKKILERKMSAFSQVF